MTQFFCKTRESRQQICQHIPVDPQRDTEKNRDIGGKKRVGSAHLIPHAKTWGVWQQPRKGGAKGEGGHQLPPQANEVVPIPASARDVPHPPTKETQLAWDANLSPPCPRLISSVPRQQRVGLSELGTASAHVSDASRTPANHILSELLSGQAGKKDDTFPSANLVGRTGQGPSATVQLCQGGPWHGMFDAQRTSPCPRAARFRHVMCEWGPLAANGRRELSCGCCRVMHPILCTGTSVGCIPDIGAHTS